MATKETSSVRDTSSLVFVNPDKKKRAEDIYLILTGKNPRESVSLDQKNHFISRFSELMSEASVSLKDKSESVLFIYKTLAGALRTPEQQARIKKAGNISRSKAAKEAVPVDDEDEDVGDKDEDEDEDDE